MNQNHEKRDFFTTSHLTILTVYTVFSILLIGEALLLGWESWALIMIAISIVACWGIHIQQRMSENMRIWIYTLCILASAFFYGTHVTSTYDLGLLMCAMIMIFVSTGMPSIVTAAQITYYMAIIYDLYQMRKAGEEFDSLVITRTLLHMAIIFVVGYLARAIMHRWDGVMSESEQEITKLTEATNRLNDFLANISHEIRTPINAIIGMTGVCIDKEKDEEIKRDMTYVAEAGKRVGEQIGDILDYSEISMDSLVINNEDYMLSSLLNDICVQLRPHLKPELELIFDVDASVPSVLNSDVGKIKKILWHLIMNGIKYTKEGGVYVRITAIEQDYGVNLCITVKDTGIGMTDDETEMAFDGFYQSDSGRTRSTNGLGLGLTIVVGFVSALHGFVQIDSEKDYGTTVRVSIPQKVVDPSVCMAVDNRDKLTLGAFLHFEKFPNPNVREFYNSMVLNIVHGLHVKMHRVNNVIDLMELLDNVRLTHLFVGEDEYVYNKEYLESIADKVLVAIVASKKVTLDKNSKVRIMEKPFYCFPVVSILNTSVHDVIRSQSRMTLPGVRALVVDDEPMNLIVARNMLGRYKMDITTVNSGEEAVDICRTEDFDVVFMDHMMPKMDGVETMKNIRKDVSGRGKKLPIVALTANAVSSAKEMFIKEGFDDFVAKPIDVAELERALKKVLPGMVEYEDIPEEDDTHVIEERVTAAEPEPEVKASEPEVEDEATVTSEPAEPSTASEPVMTAPAGTDKMSRLKQVGVDTDTGLLYCQGDEEFYISMLESFVEESADKKRDLDKFLKDEDLKNYAITVHSVKSTSKMIGIMELSDKAKALEEAAKNDDMDTVSNGMDDLMNEYDIVITNLENVLSDSSDKEVR